MADKTFFGRSWDSWISEYAEGHQNKWNQLTHTIGIPMIIISIVLGLLALIWPGLWGLAATLFILGWALQFLGHWFEGQKPEFFKDWRFLFVGTRWWLKKITGKL